MPDQPCQIATLLYCFNERDEVLLLERSQEPNRGLWSPCGGKLDTANGESPYACACREAREELGITIAPSDLHLTGIVSEHGYAAEVAAGAGEMTTRWLMFLFEVKPKLKTLPPRHHEGTFAFFRADELAGLPLRLPLPKTDIEQIWPLFWKHRGGFFAAHCRAKANGADEWFIEESRPHA